MVNSKPYSTLMSPFTKLDSNPHGKKVDVALFRAMICSVLYLTASRLDIKYVYMYKISS